MSCWHIVWNKNYSVARRAQIGELNKTWNFDVRFTNIHPEMRRDRLLKLEYKAADTKVVDGVVFRLPSPRQIRGRGRYELNRHSRNHRLRQDNLLWGLDTCDPLIVR